MWEQAKNKTGLEDWKLATKIKILRWLANTLRPFNLLCYKHHDLKMLEIQYFTGVT